MTDYYCPKCEQVTEIEQVTKNASINQRMSFEDGELVYTGTNYYDGQIDHFQCAACSEWIRNKDGEVINDVSHLLEFITNENDPETIELENYKKACNKMFVAINEIKALATQGIKARANRSDAKNNPETLRRVITNGTDKIADICFKMIKDYGDMIKIIKL